MKQLSIILLASIILVSCHSITGSGNIITQNRNINDFYAISASSGIEVEVRMGTEAKVSVEADDNVMDRIITKLEDGVLNIRYRSNTSLTNAHVKVLVTAQHLKEVHASSGAEITVKDAIKSDTKVTFTCSSSGSIKAAVVAPEVTAEANSSGTLTLSGRTRTYTAETSSSGEVASFDLLSENTDASASSSGTTDVHASVSLDASASSSGEVRYRGGAKVSQKISSSGTLEKVQ